MTAALAFLAVFAVLPARAADAPVPVATGLPAGSYAQDAAQASLVFRVGHLGFSRYTARFGRFDARLDLDPADPAASTVEATIDSRSLELNRSPPGFLDQLLGPDWLDAGRFPDIRFRSTAIVPTGPASADIVGELALCGVTAPVTLQATFSGGYASHPLDPSGTRIGFSARGTLERLAFGIALGIPPADSSMGVGDAVEVLIEAEFTRPASGAAARQDPPPQAPQP